MNILLLGSGGRENALAWKIAQSPRCEQLFIAPGNAGSSRFGTNVNISVNDFTALADFVSENKIRLIVVGPEDPLVNGIRDYFESDSRVNQVGIVGPGKSGARLEGSKEFSKQFMHRHNIPTARYKSFTKENISGAKSFLESLKPPYVLKADGLAAGKGVLILDSLDEAVKELDKMILDKKFGDAGSTVVIEEFLKGIEVSVFVLTDGKDYVLLPEAKDYKRIGEGDTGLNTGGMGAVSPVPFCDAVFMDKVKAKIINPTLQGLQNEGISYKGFIFFGLMNVEGDPHVIEYNARMGDPETEAVIPRVKSDLVLLLEAAAFGLLKGAEIETDPRSAVTIMLVSEGYPGNYEKGKIISGLDKCDGSILFHAGTSRKENEVLTSGGRVLAVTSLADTIDEARQLSMKNAEIILFDKKYFRTDIGFDLQ